MDAAAAAPSAAPDAAAEQTPSPVETLSAAVAQNPLDFNSWVQLLAHYESDAEAPVETIEATYDRFLAEFPLCFGYWNKYAQYEYARATRTSEDVAPAVDLVEAGSRARAVYERGVAAVAHSVDMWVKYLEFVIHTLRAPVDECRTALEAAVLRCGSDPLAGTIWDMYIQLETINNDMLRLNQVFKRIMHQPLTNLDEFWEKYNQFVLAQPLNVLATSEELKQLAGEDDLMDEGLLRVKIVNALEAIKKKTVEGVYRRQAFEAGIDRSYFHVTPVADSSIRNWHNYLDYEEVAGDNLRCETLYERCLIACANYEDMWVRYAEWKEKTAGFDAANAIFQRAVTVFLKYRASIYLEYATFLEAHGKLEEASSTYMTVLTHVAPKLVEAYLRYCNFERRCQNFDKVKEWYGRALDVSKDDASVHAHVVTTYANYVLRSLNDVDQAREIFERAIEHAGGALLFWLNYISFETTTSSGSAEHFPSRVTQLYERAIADSSPLGNDEKSDLWLQYADFTEMYGGSIQSVREIRQRELTWKRKNSVARDRTMKLLVWNVDTSVSSDESYEVGSKRPRVEPQQVAATTAAPVTSAATTSAAATSQASAYAQQYAGYYQGYGTQAYTQAADTTTATPAAAAYSQAYAQQYAGYYQQ